MGDRDAQYARASARDVGVAGGWRRGASARETARVRPRAREMTWNRARSRGRARVG